MGRGREPWERSEAGGVIGNERHLHHSPVSSPTEELRKGERTRPGFLGSEGLPLTKHKQKIQAWSSLLFHCCHSSFNPSEAPPWDSRPVSGAGVVHYQLLHRPRSVPTALGPAPLVTVNLFLWCLKRRLKCI